MTFDRKCEGVENPNIPLVHGSSSYLYFLSWTWTFFSHFNKSGFKFQLLAYIISAFDTTWYLYIYNLYVFLIQV